MEDAPPPLKKKLSRTFEDAKGLIDLDKLVGRAGAPALFLGAAVVEVPLVLGGAAHAVFLLAASRSIDVSFFLKRWKKSEEFFSQAFFRQH